MKGSFRYYTHCQSFFFLFLLSWSLLFIQQRFNRAGTFHCRWMNHCQRQVAICELGLIRSTAASAKKYNLGNFLAAYRELCTHHRPKSFVEGEKSGLEDCHQDLTFIKDAIGPYWRGPWWRMWFLVRLVLLAKPSTRETTNNAVRYFFPFIFLELLDKYFS